MRFFFMGNKSKSTVDKETIMPIVMVHVCNTNERQRGALIVIERGLRLDDIVDTGDLIDARINQITH